MESIFCSLHHITRKAFEKECIVTPQRLIKSFTQNPLSIDVDCWNEDANAHVYHRLDHINLSGQDVFTVWTIEASTNFKVAYHSFLTIAETKRHLKGLFAD